MVVWVKLDLQNSVIFRSLSDDETPHNNENMAHVVFSTPVSSQKAPRRDGGLLQKLKNTRFALPLSSEKKRLQKEIANERRNVKLEVSNVILMENFSLSFHFTIGRFSCISNKYK